MKRALVTGSGGFMGSWLVPELKKKYSVQELDEKSGKSILHLGDLEIDFNLVFHLAGISFVPDAAKNPYKAFQVNSFGTLNVLEAVRKQDAKLIFPSTYLYGQPKKLPISESHPLSPASTYARSKLIAEHLILQYHEDYGLPYAILRFFNIYGPGQSEKFLIPKIVAGVKAGTLQLFDKAPKRDFTFITDAVQAYIKAAASKKSGTYNIGSGKSYSVSEIVEMAKRISGKKCVVAYSAERRKNEIMDCVADAGKAKRELNWSPKVGIEEGMRRMYG
ncbi:MAG: GDP-mannose 4,6-dehydratase [Nanoarchaeota archaeon]|nr:GDP-mannose 4,6-dehydratase [Nanoarchaeota archaeon]